MDNKITQFLGIEIEREKLLWFYVQGKPLAQSRGRHVVKNGKFHVYSDATKGLTAWKGAIRRAVVAAMGELGLESLEGTLCVDMGFLMPIKDKARWWKLSETKPDKDNLEKAVLDSMGDAKLFKVGDGQVCIGNIMKLSVPTESGGVVVVVSRVKIKKSPTVQSGGQVPEWLST